MGGSLDKAHLDHMDALLKQRKQMEKLDLSIQQLKNTIVELDRKSKTLQWLAIVLAFIEALDVVVRILLASRYIGLI